MEEWGCPSHAPRGGVSPVGHVHGSGSFPSASGHAGGTRPGLAAASCLPRAGQLGCLAGGSPDAVKLLAGAHSSGTLLVF